MSQFSKDTNNQKRKFYDLENRTCAFAKKCRLFTKELPQTIENKEDIKQLTRSSGSVFANYIEANESLSKKDFYHRIKICRKEAKESCGRLTLCDCGQSSKVEKMRGDLLEEGMQLTKIFGAIVSRQS